MNLSYILRNPVLVAIYGFFLVVLLMLTFDFFSDIAESNHKTELLKTCLESNPVDQCKSAIELHNQEIVER